jgi:hypothetical protein
LHIVICPLLLFILRVINPDPLNGPALAHQPRKATDVICVGMAYHEVVNYRHAVIAKIVRQHFTRRAIYDYGVRILM